MISRLLRHFPFTVLLIFLIPQSPAGAAANPEVWISAQPTAVPGAGTAASPYDGSTQPKFDSIIASLESMQNIHIHLGVGTFQTDVTKAIGYPGTGIEPHSGWTIEGAGMYLTTLQAVGNLAGQHYDHELIKTNPSFSIDNVTVKDLTLDCNWSAMSASADTKNSEKWSVVYGTNIGGSYNTLLRVRCIHQYGSVANGAESFGLLVGGMAGGSTNNLVKDCVVEEPSGNYGPPFALGNNINSVVEGCRGQGIDDGEYPKFNTGGVGVGNDVNCTIRNNNFIDCLSIAYNDTGTLDGLTVINNTLTRGVVGVALNAGADPTWTKEDIEIAGNNINVQNRSPGYGSMSYGILINGATSSNVSISENQISFSPTGQGFLQFHTIDVDGCTGGTITDNIADEASAGTELEGPVLGQVINSYDITIQGNRTTAGGPMTGLADNYLQPLAKALNFSTRATVGAGENVLIDGFIVTGHTPKKVLVRAIGPSLSSSAVRSPLVDPTLALYNQTGKLLASNDNWKASQQADIQATKIQPANDAESAIIATLPPGTYTAVMGNKSSVPGIGLVEVYDLSPADKSSLQNVSTRGLVGTGENVIIGGLIVGKGQNPTFVARAIGPSLTKAGIHNPLVDPVLELHNGNGAIIATNDNWKDTQADALTATGLAPTDNRESAIVASLPAGSYTTVLRGSRATTGVGLVEVYRIQ